MQHTVTELQQSFVTCACICVTRSVRPNHVSVFNKHQFKIHSIHPVNHGGGTSPHQRSVRLWHENRIQFSLGDGDDDDDDGRGRGCFNQLKYPPASALDDLDGVMRLGAGSGQVTVTRPHPICAVVVGLDTLQRKSASNELAKKKTPTITSTRT